MSVKKLTIASPKKVKRLTVKPVDKINRFDANSLVVEQRVFHAPANDEVIEIQLTDQSKLTMMIRPIDPILAQISYEPEGKVWEEEIHAFLWKCEHENGMRFWTPNFSNQVLEHWKRITKDLTIENS